MQNSERDKLVEATIKKLLIAMHNGESLTVTLGNIMETMHGIRYIEERKFVYMLQGLYMDKMGGMADMAEDKNKIEGYNEAADENNFAVKLCMGAITGEE
jgi:hypothetical protein